MITITQGYDDAGLPVATAETTEDRELLAFLRSDVQGDISRCKELITQIRQVELGRVKQPVEFTGNAYTFSINGRGIRIENEFDQDAIPAEIAMEYGRQVLNLWLEAITGQK